jgi:hypothetical protein
LWEKGTLEISSVHLLALWGFGRGRGVVLCIWSSISIIAVAEDGTTRDQEEYAEEHNYRSSQRTCL